MPRQRHLLTALFVPLAALAVACSASPAPQAPAAPPAQEATYQQQAGYAQQPPAGTAAAPAGQYPAAPGGVAWPSFGEPPAADVAGTTSQLDRAEQALGLAIELLAKRDASPQKSASGTSPGAPVAQADACSIACAALASMRRSADHICDMSGPSDSTCTGAKDRVQRAEQRVTSSCPACAARR